MSVTAGESPHVAIIPWGLLIEDFLTPNGLSLEDFCSVFTGSWIFGYSAALHAAGVTSTLVCISGQVSEVTRCRHGATGAEISILPAPPAYRKLRARMNNPYGRGSDQVFRRPARQHGALRGLRFAAKEVAPYLATPLLGLARELRRRHCTAILCHEYEFPRFDVCVALGRVLGLPVFATFQGGNYQRWKSEKFTRPWAMRLASGVIVASVTERNRVRHRYPSSKVGAIPNPLDLADWRGENRSAVRGELGIASNARVAAWHGRIEIRKKGLDTLAEAWSRLGPLADGSEAVLLIIGTGSGAEELRSRLAASPPGRVVWIDRYLHRRDEIARYLSAADVYVFPSRHEGFPLAPIEAMACGLGVISTDVSGIRDVLAEGESSGGVIVPPDSSEQLSRELWRVLSDVNLCRELGRRARLGVEVFDVARVGSDLRAFMFAQLPPFEYSP